MNIYAYGGKEDAQRGANPVYRDKTVDGEVIGVAARLFEVPIESGRQNEGSRKENDTSRKPRKGLCFLLNIFGIFYLLPAWSGSCTTNLCFTGRLGAGYTPAQQDQASS